jgi:hypothetical protein
MPQAVQINNMPQSVIVHDERLFVRSGYVSSHRDLGHVVVRPLGR